MSLTIGITHCDEWANYERWIKNFDSTIQVVCLKVLESNLHTVKQFNGIIMSGGEDVYPAYYNKPEYIEQYNLHDFNKERDEFELAVLKEATTNNIPILGIFRGLQITNVFFKGTLVPDLPSKGKKGHSDGKKDSTHGVILHKENRMHTIIGEEKGTINSHHHQSADTIGKGLQVTALSDDGVVESIEQTKTGSFLTLVQWHPERMDVSNPFSGKLREAFIKSCTKQPITA
jgi:putative glutamine amidotransferase